MDQKFRRNYYQKKADAQGEMFATSYSIMIFQPPVRLLPEPYRTNDNERLQKCMAVIC